MVDQFLGYTIADIRVLCRSELYKTLQIFGNIFLADFFFLCYNNSISVLPLNAGFDRYLRRIRIKTIFLGKGA